MSLTAGPYCNTCPHPARCGMGDGCFRALGLHSLADDSGLLPNRAGDCGGGRDDAPVPADLSGEGGQQ